MNKNIIAWQIGLTPFLMITINPVIWYLILILFLIGILVFSYLLFKYSKKPEEWGHKAISYSFDNTGRLFDLAETIKVTPKVYSKNMPLKNMILQDFLKKFQLRYGISEKEVDDLYKNRTNDFIRLINDDEISNFIYSNNWANITQKNMSSEESFLFNLRSIIFKMKKWGG